MKNVKGLIVTALFLCFCGNSFAQVEFHARSLFDQDAANMYLDAQRSYLNTLSEMAMYRRQLMPIIVDTYKVAYDRYSRGNYYECAKVISAFFENYTIYNGLGNICVNLYELYGMSLIKLNDYSNGLSLLRKAMEQGSSSARQELDRIFQDYYSQAYRCYENGDYSSSHIFINNTFATGLQSSSVYILRGDVYTKQHKFDEAKESYKVAKKMGSTLAPDRLKLLKQVKKEYYRNK